MRRSLYLLALGMPLMIGAAPPPMHPLLASKSTDVVEVNVIDRFLQDSGIRKRDTSSKRTRTRAQTNRAAIPKPPALGIVPVPLAKPTVETKAEAAQAATTTVQPPQTPPLPAPAETMSEKAAPDAAEKQPAPQTTNPASGEPASGDAANAPVVRQPATPAEPAREVEVPKPEPKPDEPAASDTAAGNPPASGKDAAAVGAKEADQGQKPEATAEDEKAEDDVKQGEKQEASTPPPPLVEEDPDELKACLSDLAAIGAKFEPTDPIDDGNGCGIRHPIDVAEVLPGVDLGGATMRCKTALTLAHWLKDTVQPAMNIAMPGRRIVGLVPGSTYQCRLRNSASTGKISEHARGNAYDVAAFRLDNGEKMEMKPRTEDSTLEGAFQRTATAGACLHFTTVLSPGSDAAHETHLHLDVLERKGGYRYCR